MTLRIRRIDLESVDDTELDIYPDRHVQQTFAWVRFLAESVSGEPVLGRIEEGGHVLGYFTGLVVKILGFRILGSPFRGWTTSYMGFNLREDVPRRNAIESLARFAFDEVKCHHVEITDRYASFADYASLGFETETRTSYIIDLTQSQDRMFANMTSPCRRCIRKAAKNGVVIEQVHDEAFADEYYEQFRHVVHYHGDVPIYGIGRVRTLVRTLLPTGNLLMFRARNSEGISIATGIFGASNRTMIGWGLASWRQYSNVRPNEALLWHAVKHWKAQGGLTFDFGGHGEYKKKYGATEITIPHAILSRNRLLTRLRNGALTAFQTGKHLLARITTEGGRSGKTG